MPRLPALFLFLLLLRMDSVAASTPHPALNQLPREILWAWERPEDLRWLPADIGVAYVAATILLRGDEALAHPRANPLRLLHGTPVVPVLHVDMSWRKPPALNAAQSAKITKELLRVAKRANRNVVQLDFEVRRSQRPFLASTIAAIRQQLDPAIALSVTALASWCLDDYWMHDSAANEIVPMAFRMGPGQREFRQRLARQQGFTRQECASAIGLSSDEPAIATTTRRHYHFSPQPWSAANWHAVQAHPDHE